MHIKDIETRTGLSRANIRYYEQEGLVHPVRARNGYRDYIARRIWTRCCASGCCGGWTCPLRRSGPCRPGSWTWPTF